MDEIIKKFSLSADKFMPEKHQDSQDLIIVPVDHSLKIIERTKKFKETGDSRYIYQNQLDRGCCQHDMVYRNFKDLQWRRNADKVISDKTFNIAKNLKYDGYQRGIVLRVYKCIDKKTAGGTIRNEIISNKQLEETIY